MPSYNIFNFKISEIDEKIDALLEEYGGSITYNEAKKILESQGTKVTKQRYILRLLRYRRINKIRK